MRIVSKQRDYYDSVQSYGQDLTNVYVRKETKIELFYPDIQEFKLEDLLDKSYYRWSRNTPREFQAQRYIGYCGKLYPTWFLETSFPMKKGLIYSEYTKKIWAYSSKEIADYMKECKLKKELEYFTSKDNKKYYWMHRSRFKKDPLDAFIKSFVTEEYEYLFHMLKTPIFVIEPVTNTNSYRANTSHTILHARITKDPILRKYSFYKLFDAYQTFQDISFYLEGVLGIKAPAMASVPDEYLLEGKGFDKWSFKTLPGQKKRKRRT